jgi:threonine dehydratase
VLSSRDFDEARERLMGIAQLTPLNYSRSLSELVDCEVYLKLENLQKTGSFKLRGAVNKIMSLDATARGNGVIAASAGNHAQGVALGSQRLGVNATIVMPEGAPLAKVSATRNYGAEVILHGAVYDDAYARAVEIQEQTGGTFVHAFNDPLVIAGQGTIGLEIMEQLPSVDVIFVPIGGGGLAAGVSAAVKSFAPGVKVIGVQASGAPSMYESLQAGKIVTLSKASTIADGIAVKEPGSLTFDLVAKYVDSVVTVTDEEIAEGILTLLERCKVVAEGAGAVSIAAVLSRKLNLSGKKVVCLISGGNIDVNFMAQIIERGLIKTGRKVKISTFIPDKIGTLQRLLEIVSACRANIISVDHSRTESALPLGTAEVELTLETESIQHIDRILEALTATGYPVSLVTHSAKQY